MQPVSELVEELGVNDGAAFISYLDIPFSLYDLLDFSLSFAALLDQFAYLVSLDRAFATKDA